MKSILNSKKWFLVPAALFILVGSGCVQTNSFGSKDPLRAVNCDDYPSAICSFSISYDADLGLVQAEWTVKSSVFAVANIELRYADTQEWQFPGLVFDCSASNDCIHFEDGEVMVQELANGRKKFTYIEESFSGYGANFDQARAYLMIDGVQGPDHVVELE